MELRIRNLSKTYPNGVRALKRVTLDIPTGMFGLLGPNGAGKSTLMRTIATLQEPDDGEVALEGLDGGPGAGEAMRGRGAATEAMDRHPPAADVATGDPTASGAPTSDQATGGPTASGGSASAGLDVLREKRRVRELLGYLPQDFGVYPKVTAEAMLDHFAVLKGITNKRERKETVAALLRQTNLYEAKDEKLGTFSGGMRQRFGIAQALLGDPKLIIVDEPTAGLDPTERIRFLNLLSEIGENVVVILSTHIVDDVSDLCSRMAILDEGEVRLTGVPSEVIERLQGAVWKKVIEREELPEHQRLFEVLSTRLSAGDTVIHVLADERPDPGFDPVDADLEDVYFATLKRADGRVTA